VEEAPNSGSSLGSDSKRRRTAFPPPAGIRRGAKQWFHPLQWLKEEPHERKVPLIHWLEGHPAGMGEAPREYNYR